MKKPRVWYLPPESHTRKVFLPETFDRLLAACEVRATPGERRVTAHEVERECAEFDAIVTGWGSPPFTSHALVRATQLRIVAHSAGSVKFLFTRAMVREILIPRRITVFSANGAIADNVAEATIGYLIAVSRRWFEQIRTVRDTEQWADPNLSKSEQFLRGATVGIVSLSRVGREVVRLLQPFDVRILVYDPYASEEEIRSLGSSRRCDLDELFSSSDFVTLHAPSIEETRHMVGRRQLQLLREGAVLVNTSRGSVIDHDALLAEARRGRIRVVLDVTDPEPLPPAHPLRRLPNVYVTPHVSGAGRYGYLKIGEMTLRALEDCFAGREVEGAVELELWDRLA